MTDSPLLQLACSLAPPWADEKIMALPEADLEVASTWPATHYWIESGDLDVFRVVGTRHPDYIGLTWGGFLRTGKRMTLNHRLWHDNPGYYTETTHKMPTMDYVTLDGLDWYVGDDGNHRTAIARFWFASEGWTQLRGVSLSDRRPDLPFLVAWQACESAIRDRRLPWTLTHDKAVTRREDGPGWKLDHYLNTAKLDAPADVRRRFPAVLDTTALYAVARYAAAPAWRRWL